MFYPLPMKTKSVSRWHAEESMSTWVVGDTWLSMGFTVLILWACSTHVKFVAQTSTTVHPVFKIEMPCEHILCKLYWDKWVPLSTPAKRYQ